jgi:hypothetical protein
VVRGRGGQEKGNAGDFIGCVDVAEHSDSGQMLRAASVASRSGGDSVPMNKRPDPNKRPGPTSIQEIALNLIFVVMGESRINRTFDEYMAIAKRLPPLKVMTAEVNRLLNEMHKCNGCCGLPLPQLCRFKAGDEWKRITYEPYPKAISIETIREALVVAGMREPRWQKRRNAL